MPSRVYKFDIVLYCPTVAAVVTITITYW